jgi:hypothetical protein
VLLSKDDVPLGPIERPPGADASAVACLDDDFEACIAQLRFPLGHRRRAQGATLQELADSLDRSLSTMRRATRTA